MWKNGRIQKILSNEQNVSLKISSDYESKMSCNVTLGTEMCGIFNAGDECKTISDAKGILDNKA